METSRAVVKRGLSESMALSAHGDCGGKVRGVGGGVREAGGLVSRTSRYNNSNYFGGFLLHFDVGTVGCPGISTCTLFGPTILITLSPTVCPKQ